MFTEYAWFRAACTRAGQGGLCRIDICEPWIPECLRNTHGSGQPAPEPGKEAYVGSTYASPGYLNVYGIRMVQGRDFNESDRPGALAVAIVNETMARKFWPGGNPIGRRIGGTDPANPGWAEVVGVMADFKGAADFYNPNLDNSKFLLPWAQNNHRFISFNVRTAGDKPVV